MKHVKIVGDFVMGTHESLEGKQHKGTGVFFPPCLQDSISSNPPTPTGSSGSASATGCGLLFSSRRQHAISVRWPREAVRAPAAAAVAKSPPKRHQPGTSRPAARPDVASDSNATNTRPRQLQLPRQPTETSQTEAAHRYSLGLFATRSTSTDSTDSSSSGSSPAFAAAHSGFWGAASTTAQPKQLPAGASYSSCQLAPAMSDGLAVSGVDMWSDERGGLPATMWFDAQHDSMQLQAESSAHSLSWASNDTLMLLHAPSLDPPGLSTLARTCSSSGSGSTQGARAASHSPDASAFCEPASAPCLACGSGSLLQDQGDSWGGLMASSWAPPPLSLLEQQLLLAQGGSLGSMAPGMSGLDPTSADLLTACSAGLMLPLGQPLPAMAMPAATTGPVALSTAAQSKLQQLATIDGMKQALERELLDLLRG